MTSSSDDREASARTEDLKFLYASNCNVSNFVSVKLSSKLNYRLWKTQMLCLFMSHNMAGIVDPKFVSPRASSNEIMNQYHSLLKGWILGSVSKTVLGAVDDLKSAKDVWDKLAFFFVETLSPQQDSALTTSEAETETKTKDIDAVIEETKKNGEDMLEIVSTDTEMVSTENKTEGEDAKNKTERKNKIKDKNLHKAARKGDWPDVESELKKDKDLAGKAISNDGNTILHIAVARSHNYFVKKLLSYLNDKQVLKKRDSDGSTALHIAANVGNKYAAYLLVNKNEALLRIKDHKEEEPLHKAYKNMHLDTIWYLVKAMDKGKEQSSRPHPHVEIKVNLLVNVIYAKRYDLASEIIHKYPKLSSESDDVLMAIAKTFPSGLDYWQKLIYPTNRRFFKEMVSMFGIFFGTLFFLPRLIINHFFGKIPICETWYQDRVLRSLLVGPKLILLMIYLVILIICWLCQEVYSFLWSMGMKLEGPIKNIGNKKNEWDEAKKVLKLVCKEIVNLEFRGTHHPYFTRPILEAACQNAYKVVREILSRSPESIHSTDKNGHDIIMLAIIHRSEKIYNLIYDIGEHKNIYRTVEDNLENNILHMVGRLASSHELNRRRGAALQLQRELQWHAEVKKHIFPAYITRENVFKETPDMVFTREHEKLLKEGENWMKSTAESCSITAGLITTIVFAAAITVPGGNDQVKGIPLFTKDVAFIIFAVSDAISLFASSTALLVFLSILTARFSERDFLVSLPSRMLIGLFSLLLSTIAMMVAFSATLFLVFCHQKLWMLAPICVSAFIPIAFFVALQFPLMVDIFHSTHLRIFGKQRKSVRRSIHDNIQLLFRK